MLIIYLNVGLFIRMKLLIGNRVFRCIYYKFYKIFVILLSVRIMIEVGWVNLIFVGVINVF